MSYSCLCKSILRLFRPCQMLWHKSFQAKQGGNKKSSKSQVFSSLTWSIKWVETLSEFKFLFSSTIKSRVLPRVYNIVTFSHNVTVNKHQISPSWRGYLMFIWSFIDNLKKPASASKQDRKVLTTLQSS